MSTPPESCRLPPAGSPNTSPSSVCLWQQRTGGGLFPFTKGTAMPTLEESIGRILAMVDALTPTTPTPEVSNV